VRIATYNVNGVNGRLPSLLAWLAETQPDIVCLQELKTPEERFPVGPLRQADYGSIWHGESRWNGVAILAKGCDPVQTRRGLPGDKADVQSRYLEAAVNGVIVASLYAPNGNPQPGPKFDYKLAWLKRLNAHAGKLLKSGAPAVIAGDFNIVPTPFDIYPTKSWDKDALVQPESRAAFGKLLKKGWIDALREQHPDEPMYTFWSYWRNRYERDAGLRIDHLLLSPALSPRLAQAGVDRKVRGKLDPSDHAPAWIVLK
jgi:exodeoxyribonuclease-3